MTTDIAKLVERSARLQIDDIDFDAFTDQPLDDDALRCLRYMHDVEGHTICYLRDILATRVHRDAEITAFLACWSYEEHWHGHALGRVLDAHGETGGSRRIAAMRRTLPRSDQWRPTIFSAISWVSTQLPTVHMAWGAINEWTTQAGYRRLIERADHPVLTELLRRIMRQEGRHIDFYANQARERLNASTRARHFTRAALRRYWAPVGSGVMPPAEIEFLADYLFGDDEGREVARRLDRQIDRLAGLDGLHLVEGAVAQALQERRRRVPATPPALVRSA
jgi:hypothetical protein